MSTESTELKLLNEKLSTLTYRTSILNFQIVAFRFNSRCQFLLNHLNNFHLNNCIWSKKDATCGPDTCHCCFVLDSPEAFFEKQIKNPSNFYSVSELDNINRPTDDCKHYKPLNLYEEESLKDFYKFRVLDSKNIFRWYELYEKKTKALYFQIKIRELKMEHQIDAVYNLESNEWHLTDCIRSVKWKSGPDTCHCYQAMLDPKKYLKKRYHFIHIEKVFEKMKLQEIPQYYKK